MFKKISNEFKNYSFWKKWLEDPSNSGNDMMQNLKFVQKNNPKVYPKDITYKKMKSTFVLRLLNDILATNCISILGTAFALAVIFGIISAIFNFTANVVSVVTLSFCFMCIQYCMGKIMSEYRDIMCKFANFKPNHDTKTMFHKFMGIDLAFDVLIALALFFGAINSFVYIGIYVIVNIFIMGTEFNKYSDDQNNLVYIDTLKDKDDPTNPKYNHQQEE